MKFDFSCLSLLIEHNINEKAFENFIKEVVLNKQDIFPDNIFTENYQDPVTEKRYLVQLKAIKSTVSVVGLGECVEFNEVDTSELFNLMEDKKKF